MVVSSSLRVHLGPRGTHYLSDLRFAYEPSSNEEVKALIHVPGGNGTRSASR